MSAPQIHNEPLRGIVLPADGALLRKHLRRPERWTDHYLARYDRTTLIYDCVYQADAARYLMVAPPLLNLWPALRDGLRLDGAPVRTLRRRRHDKYEVIHFRAPKGKLTFETGTESRPVATRPELSEPFRGLNCVATMNRDNPLEWIRDWALWLTRVHGLEGVVIFDNLSTGYTARDIAATLTEVPGLKQVAIISAPYPYGTTDRVERGELRPNFLQPAMLNLARTAILRHARAVLNADIDELVLSRNGRSVFDAAAARPNRAVRLPVRWAYPAPDVTGPAPQRTHLFRDADKRLSNRKWCAVPSGAMSRIGWYVHHVGGELFKLLPEDFNHEVVHCRAASTGWNLRKARHAEMGALSEDPELVRAMSRLAGEGESG